MDRWNLGKVKNNMIKGGRQRWGRGRKGKGEGRRVRRREGGREGGKDKRRVGFLFYTSKNKVPEHEVNHE